MKKNFKWYFLIVISIILILVYIGYLSTDMDGGLRNDTSQTEEPLNRLLDNNQKENSKKLYIPPFLEDKNPKEGRVEFDLKVEYGEKEFIETHKASTLGYNGDYLGPVIKVNRGDQVRINVNNTLDEATTVHWHGLEVSGEMDGGPHQVIEANTIWEPYFTIDQPAATLWYHPHLLHETGEQVYKGLAGLFFIEDENSKKLNIPKEYGVNDIPLIIQDKRFTDDGKIPYDLDMQDIMNGFLGDTIIVNGSINPELDVRNEVIRLRFLNGSNARTYNFNFNETEFYQIASDGGFLEESVKMNSISLAPAERVEILLDLTGYEIGDKITFRDNNYDLMDINIIRDSKKDSKIPKELVNIDDYNRDEIVGSREFIMSGMGPMVNINGKQMDIDRIDEKLNLGELEEWIIRNESSPMGNMGRMGMMNSTPHPFHIHGVQFRIIERNGKDPPLNERGWKDTVMLDKGEEARILVKFKKKGLFMYHCHILEHEDSGMMGQFLVE